MTRRQRLTFGWSLGLLMCSLSATAFAQGSDGLLNGVQNEYAAATVAWLNAALRWASVIFAGLITVEIAWSLLEIFLGSRDLDSLLNSLVLRIVWIGTAVFLLNQAPNIVLPAIGDFIRIGAGIASSSGPVVATTPDGIFAQGFKIAQALNASTNGDNFVQQTLEAVPQTIACVMVLFGFALAAAQFLLTMIQIYIVVGGGALLLGFIGSRWTLPFAEAYPRMVVSSGMKLVAVMLVAGLGATLGSHWVTAAAKTGQGPVHWLTIGASASIYGLIAWNLPNIMMHLAGAAPAFSAARVFAAATGAVQSAARGARSANGASSSGGGGGSSIAAIEKAASTS